MKSLIALMLAASCVGQTERPRRRGAGARSKGGWERVFGEPRNAVLFVLGSVVLLGGGRRLLNAWRGRDAVARLDDPNVTREAVAAVVDYGRNGLMDLFRLLEKSPDSELRDAAGHAISVLWARDDLIAEEEKALVRRGFRVEWEARRRYPRALHRPIPVKVRYGVPFLQESGPGVRPNQLEWSYRIAGAKRASLEVFSPWVRGPGLASFELIPADFETNGPHKLALHARVKTVDLTESWEIELPHIPFSFELDPRLDVEAIQAMSDDTRAEVRARSVRLVPLDLERSGRVPAFFPLDSTLAIRDLPALEFSGPLPCDLAHAIEVEIEGITSRFAAGEVVIHAQETALDSPLPRDHPLTLSPIDHGSDLGRPGLRRLRVHLIPDPTRGWADPDVRSLWPRTIETDWVEVEIVRR